MQELLVSKVFIVVPKCLCCTQQAINNVQEEIRLLEEQNVTNQSHKVELEQKLSDYQGLFSM